MNSKLTLPLLDFLRMYPSDEKNCLLSCNFPDFLVRCFGIALKNPLHFASKSSLFIKKNTFSRSLFFLLFWTCSVASAQTPLLDSLKKAADRSDLPDTMRIKALGDLAWELKFDDEKSAMAYGQKALTMAQKAGFKKWIANCQNDLASVHLLHGRLDEATKMLNEALAIRQELKDELGVASILNKLASVNFEKGALDKSLEYHFQCARIFEKFGHKKNLAQTYANIGSTFTKENLNLEKAKYYALKAKALYEEMGGHPVLAQVTMTLGNAVIAKDTFKAISYYEESMKLSEQYKDRRVAIICGQNLGDIYISLKQYAKADFYLSQARQAAESLNAQNELLSIYVRLARLYATYESVKQAEGKAIAQKALELSKKLGNREEEQASNFFLAAIHDNLGEYKQAFLYLNESMNIQKELVNAEKVNAIAEMEGKYQNEVKERKILELDKQKAQAEASANRTKLMLALATLLLLIGGGFAYFKIQKQKHEAQNKLQQTIIEEREAGLKAVIEATEEERKRVSKELHDGVGQQLSGLRMAFQKLALDIAPSLPAETPRMERLTNILDEACTEVRSISHQMMPRALEESGLVVALEEMLHKSLTDTSLKYEFETFGLDKRLSANIEVTLYRVAQELVNNIIKHSGATMVSVQLRHTKGNIILMVEDNGKGFNPKNASDGHGMKNINSRLSTVHGNFDFEPSTEHGTVAIVRVPAQFA